MQAQGQGQTETELRAAVARRVGPTRFDLWFGEGVRLGMDGDSLVVGVPNGFFREWIQGHFSRNLVEAAEEVTGHPSRLSFRVDNELEPDLGSVVSRPNPGEGRPQGPAIVIPTVPAPAEKPATRNQARSLKKLSDFVTGPCNRLAHAAAVEVADSAGSTFNPLVIHGAVGLGKSHLMEGIGHALRAKHPSMNVVQLTAEGFTNGFLDAMRTNTLPQFRSRHRNADALIVDDVHFLAAKRATLHEFLHTFNALLRDGAPIVLASDQHPRLVTKLTEELTTRFLGGMVVKVESPDPTTRRAILKNKALARGVDVPDAVIAYIADHLRSSVRELEGALHNLIAHAVLTGKRLDLNLAKSALRDTIRHTAQAVALKDVERAVCNVFTIDPDALKSDGRARAVAQPRMIAMYLARKHTGAAYSEIGRFFGGRNHSTVISAEKKVLGWLRDEERNALLAGFETISDILTAIEREIGS